MEPEGTYLLWLDFSSYSLTDRELRDTLIHKGKVVLNPGISFGPQGSQHMRLNLACSKETLEEGLLRIKVFIKNSCPSFRTAVLILSLRLAK